MPTRLTVGDTAPTFCLAAHDGSMVDSRQLLQQGPLVLFFYPKDGTAGCTREACGFRDAYSDFVSAGANVVGISSDDNQAHQQFATQHHLPFKLLADPDNSLRQQFGVPRTWGILPGRVTYIINRQGIIEHIFAAQLAVYKHVQEARRIVQKLV